MTIKTAHEFHELVVRLFGSQEAGGQYGLGKGNQCSKWYIFYTDATDTEILRPQTTDAFDVKLDSIVAFPQSIGTRRIFYFEPLGVRHSVDDVLYRQMAMRINACFCSACISAASRTNSTQLKRRRPRQPLIPTLNPSIEGCVLGEGWDYQQIRERRKQRMAGGSNVANDVSTATSAAPLLTATVETLFWAQCDACGKWRTTKQLVQECDFFVCNDKDVTRFEQYASCEAGLEEGAEEA